MNANGKSTCLVMMLLALLIAESGTARGQIPDCLSARRPGQSLRQEASIVTRFAPLPVAQQAIQATGTSLVSVMLPADLQAVSISHVGSRLARGELPDESYRSWMVRADTPDTIAHFRGQQITLFPRVFLLHPRIAMLRVVPGDSVATFSLGSAPGETNDGLKNFFESSLRFRQVRQSNEIGLITLTDGHRQSIFLSLDIGQSLGNSLPWDYEGFSPQQNTDNFFDSRKENQWSESSNFLTGVNVLTRHINGFHIRWIVPSKNYGRFSYRGDLFFQLLTEEYWETEFTSPRNDPRLIRAESIDKATEEQLIEQWNNLLARFSGITLISGDTVAFTTLETITLNQQ